MSFRVGEIATAMRPPGCGDPYGVHGLEVTVVGPLRRRRFSTGEVALSYLTDWPGNPGRTLRAKPIWLKRRDDTVPWSSCAWQPAKVTA